MRLDKFLSSCGAGTRTEVKKLLKYGGVSVNGEIIKKAETKINENSDMVCVNDERMIYKRYVYLMMNKPKDCVSATYDGRYRTVIDLVPEEYLHYDLFPVGRLDVDTEGLLVLTNDGQLAHNILSPKKHVAKVYYAETEHECGEDDSRIFASGMDLGDFTAMPAGLERNGNGYFVTICEGKFHQVKRMFEKVGNKVTCLKRIKMGGLELDEDLKPGEMREMSEEEVEKLWK